MNSREDIDLVSQYIEKHLPIQIHFQLCEGLRQVMDPTKFVELTNFEHKKLSEILEFVHKCKGFLPEIGLLS